MNYKSGDKVIVKVEGYEYTGEIGIVMDSITDKNILLWYISNKVKYPLFINEKNIVKKVESRHMCPECGVDYPSDELPSHLMYYHGMSDNLRKEKESIKNKYLEDQAQEELKQMDDTIKLKAEQYDRICEMMFSACGIVEDGESIKYIIDPETVADELLRIIVDDDKIDRQTFVDKKKRLFSDAVGW